MYGVTNRTRCIFLATGCLRLLNLGAAVVKLLPELGKRPGGKAVVKQLEPESTEVHEHGVNRARAE